MPIVCVILTVVCWFCFCLLCSSLCLFACFIFLFVVSFCLFVCFIFVCCIFLSVCLLVFICVCLWCRFTHDILAADFFPFYTFVSFSLNSQTT